MDTHYDIGCILLQARVERNARNLKGSSVAASQTGPHGDVVIVKRARGRATGVLPVCDDISVTALYAIDLLMRRMACLPARETMCHALQTN